jgi:hypothetical protein
VTDGGGARLERLSPARRALAERLLAERTRARDPGPVGRGDPGLPAPLSYQQARVWPRERAAHRATSLIPSAVPLGPGIDPGAMEAAWHRLGERHRALRTVFPEDGVQRGDGPELAFERLDLAGAGPDEVERQAADLAAEPMDLARGPLARARLLRLAPDDHVLLLAVHHLVTDAWSQLVCFRELRALYRDAAGPQPAVQYADYAEWQRRAAAGGRFDPLLDHWARTLAGVPPALDLPVGPPVGSPWDGFQLGVLDLEVDPERTAALGEAARAAGASSFMVLLAAVAAVLAHTSGQGEVVIGTPAAGRVRAGLEDVVGFFANPLPLRVALDPTASFGDLLGRARSASTDAFARQEVPVDLLLERLDLPPPAAGRAPLFQAAAVQQNVGERLARQAGLGAPERRPGEPWLLPFLPFYSPASAPFDLGVQLVERGGMLTGNLEYDASRVPGDLAEAVRERLLGLLVRGAERPEAPLARLL